MATASDCCGAGATRRRLAAAAGATLVPGVLLGVAPKCPLCVIAYLSAVGVSAAGAAAVLPPFAWGLLAVVVAVAVAVVAVAGLAARRRARGRRAHREAREPARSIRAARSGPKRVVCSRSTRSAGSSRSWTSRGSAQGPRRAWPSSRRAGRASPRGRARPGPTSTSPTSRSAISSASSRCTTSRGSAAARPACRGSRRSRPSGGTRGRAWGPQPVPRGRPPPRRMVGGGAARVRRGGRGPPALPRAPRHLGSSVPGGEGADGAHSVSPSLGLDKVLGSDWDGGLFVIDARGLAPR
jgi:hypothetical protein